jgi:hypothetical protein
VAIMRLGYRIIGGILAVGLLAGCAEQSVQGGAVGATGGAVAGAIIGHGKNAGQNAVLGAVIGGLLGALVGETVAHRQTAAAAPSTPPPPTPVSAGPPPPPGGQWTVVSAPPPPVGTPVPPADPTRGVITNSTPWEVHVFIDTPPGSPGPLLLRPGESAPTNLDIGQHRIVAQAFVDTQFGRRLVGTFDQILAVDPRAPGWTIRFFEANF